MKEWSFVCPILIAWMACSGCSHTAAHYIDAGNRYYQGGRYEDASLQYRKALQRDPNSGEAYYRLGLTAIRRTDLPAGFADLQRAAAMLPSRKDVADSFQQATVELADFSLAALRANAAPRQRYHDEAVKLANLLLSNNAKSYEGLRLKGDLALLDGAPQAAIEFFKMADAAKPMQPAAILGWVQALFAVGENQQGEELGRTLIRHAGSFTPAYRVLYFEYIGRGRTADGEALLREQIQNNPKDTAARLQLAAHYARFGTPPQVQAVVAEVLDHASEFREAHLMVGD
ncbi:MAG TPA: tetratricopeptide repeat protein, partial [Bryobacteraceae bacterium]|nr:tetratricopeptide repeat protein [Bryobacteraceae bacterium]